MPKTLLTNAQKKGLFIEILSYKQNINRVIICQSFVLTISNTSYSNGGNIFSLAVFWYQSMSNRPSKAIPLFRSESRFTTETTQASSALQRQTIAVTKTKFTQNSALAVTPKHDMTQNHNLDGLVLCNDTPKFSKNQPSSVLTS
jgi:hypothetical protein